MALDVRQEELDTLAPEWAALLDRTPEPVPFLHPTWHRVWLDEFQDGRELLLLAVRDGDALVGVAPLLRSDGQLAFVGNYSICDYMDFTVAPDRATEVFGALLGALRSEDWNEIELRGLRDDSPTVSELLPAAERAGLKVEREDEAVAPRVQLPESWEAYQAALNKKDRHELRRKLRRLGELGELQLNPYTRAEDVAEHLPIFIRLMVESRGDKANFMSEQIGRFFHRMAPALASDGLIRLYELELNGSAIASVLCFDQGNRLFLYNSGYDPQYAQFAVGLGSKAMCLQDAIESKRTCVDFLRGHEPYKYDLGSQDRQIYKATIRR
jgi:CelD/BcsL family acetyltransferase involved in cellulose biosynthesis